MSSSSHIEWTNATWNPVTGCTKVSSGCAHCYAERISKRFGRDFSKIELHPERLEIPLHWRKPRMIFVNSMSDLFHEKVPFEVIDKVFAVMALCPQHTFQILTKRPERMAEYLATWPMDSNAPDRITDIAHTLGHPGIGGLCERPLCNVWLGTSVEDQGTADRRIPRLLGCPAAVRFVSYEPALGPVKFRGRLRDDKLAPGIRESLQFAGHSATVIEESMRGVDWVILGGESGPRARPMHPDWVRSVRDQCAAAGVPFFFKQWGEWIPRLQHRAGMKLLAGKGWGTIHRDGRFEPQEAPEDGNDNDVVLRVGKKSAGAMLDGRLHREWPSIANGSHNSHSSHDSHPPEAAP